MSAATAPTPPAARHREGADPWPVVASIAALQLPTFVAIWLFPNAGFQEPNRQPGLVHWLIFDDGPWVLACLVLVAVLLRRLALIVPTIALVAAWLAVVSLVQGHPAAGSRVVHDFDLPPGLVAWALAAVLVAGVLASIALLRGSRMSVLRSPLWIVAALLATAGVVGVLAAVLSSRPHAAAALAAQLGLVVLLTWRSIIARLVAAVCWSLGTLALAGIGIALSNSASNSGVPSEVALFLVTNGLGALAAWASIGATLRRDFTLSDPRHESR